MDRRVALVRWVSVVPDWDAHLRLRRALCLANLPISCPHPQPPTPTRPLQVATFEGLSKPCEAMSDLADGVLLSEILAEIAPDHFTTSGLAMSPDGWGNRQRNLRTLNRSLEALFREDGHDGADFSDVDVAAIAKGEDEEGADLETLVSRVIACVAMQGDVHSILDLDQATQRVLMQVIQQVMRAVPTRDDDASDDEGEGGFAPASPRGGAGTELLQARRQLAEMQRKCRALERESGEAKEANDDLCNELEALQAERRRERAELEEEKRRAARADQRGGGSGASSRSRAQFAAERAALEEQVSELVKDRDALKRLGESAMETSAAKLRAVGDELEVARESAAELSKVRRQCDKLRKKLEASDGLRAQLGELDAKCSECVPSSPFALHRSEF